MHNLPLQFSSEANANQEFGDAWSIRSGPMQATCAIPAEFGGVGDGFSPEDFFLQALINCFVGTFKVYAKASRLTFSNLNVKGQLTVDKNESMKICMKKAFLQIEIHGVNQPSRIETIVAKTLRDGFILNSVKTEIEHKLLVHINTEV